jgi:hypothetical protein
MVRRPLLFAPVMLLIGCSHESPVETHSEQPQQISQDFKRLAPVLAALQKPAGMRLCEGLPGEFWEPELREKERARKETIELRGYPFYKEMLEFKDDNAEQIAGILSSRASFKSYQSNTKCGSFQPDYAVVWDRGEATTHILISLECGEVKMFGPQADLHCGLSREAAQKLRDLLAPYRKNRPAAA